MTDAQSRIRQGGRSSQRSRCTAPPAVHGAGPAHETARATVSNRARKAAGGQSGQARAGAPHAGHPTQARVAHAFCSRTHKAAAGGRQAAVVGRCPCGARACKAADGVERPAQPGMRHGAQGEQARRGWREGPWRHYGMGPPAVGQAMKSGGCCGCSSC